MKKSSALIERKFTRNEELLTQLEEITRELDAVSLRTKRIALANWARVSSRSEWARSYWTGVQEELTAREVADHDRYYGC